MSDEKQEWQALIPELLKDWWHEEEALWLFTGYISDEYSFTSIRTGLDDTGGMFGNIFRRINDEKEVLEKIWTNSSHPSSEDMLRASSFLSSNRQYSKYYFIYWASKIPLIQLDWLDWAFEQGYLNREELERVEYIALGRSAESDTERPAPLGARKEENLLRVIAILKWALLDPELKKHFPFESQAALAEWISNNFLGSDFAGKGLSSDSLGRTFSEANVILSKQSYENRGK